MPRPTTWQVTKRSLNRGSNKMFAVNVADNSVTNNIDEEKPEVFNTTQHCTIKKT